MKFWTQGKPGPQLLRDDSPGFSVITETRVVWLGPVAVRAEGIERVVCWYPCKASEPEPGRLSVEKTGDREYRVFPLSVVDSPEPLGLAKELERWDTEVTTFAAERALEAL